MQPVGPDRHVVGEGNDAAVPVCEIKHLANFERSPQERKRWTARMLAAASLSRMGGSDDLCLPLYGLERSPEALHARRHLVGRSKVKEQHAVPVSAYHLFEARSQLDASPGSQPALEHGELQALTVAFDDRENAPPAFPIGNVVRHDEEAFIWHERSAGCVVWNARDLAQKVAGKQATLNDDDAPHADAVAEYRMDGFLI